MARTLAILFLLVGISGCATVHTHAPKTAQSVETVNFCDLFRHPARYQGKTVETTAIYAADIERVTFFDGGCMSEATANAVFTDGTRGTEKISKALRKHKLRPALLTVTMVATFIDEYAGNSITFRGNRYTLKVKEVLAATQFNTRPEANAKH